ncbi:zinc finger protein 451 [Pundamilia nyererei]|uniref:Zinc finger protein 451 n=1 Tax=Pundamilia nyererei TaxID=303518 RepID=A0A3B4GSY6_9CICH|nr:PREDICTED: zinc finger protein 451 [Pundamilia nyererei]XP_005737194.1 PREDICTED: zinc finger protein 451 [Pundamilia nyererei]XP_005737195.1 PREDICTED: zinc finger protein 451 [Pundamilia nyererei]XP_005737196.1 PREDICTED: zinc finger protein 451 [Pundamilia nyererei]XP_005737197.1 PREDICTED: zinc finger protein 451 [Pundamilia nyererei]
MSSPVDADEDEVEKEVEFVSEGPLRPVLECIDLLSDSEDEGCSSLPNTLEDKISRHKARVTSTLDRLAHQVAVQKKERADKCRAFKEKQILQKAHGQQELAVSAVNGINQEAKRCVDMWLKMPGLKPGAISAGSEGRQRASFHRTISTRHTCPVINCGRVYDNASLLDGHLKRFDHSPCDPTINLKGSPSEFFACVACGKNFQAKESWRNHVKSKVSSSNADGHSINQMYQRIVCFACPACYNLFNLRDECLQHMSAESHFKDSLALRGSPLPVPVPQHVKNRLIALCKDVAFSVRCSLCHNVLISHQAAQAHFNVYCRQGCAVAKADKTIVQVMNQLQVRGQCSVCCEIFLSQAEIERHRESMQHEVELNQTMAKALLQHCRFSEIQHLKRARDSTDTEETTGLATPLKRNRKSDDHDRFPAKQQSLGTSVTVTSSGSVTAWCCECGLQFSDEAGASKHLLAVNQIFHQCGVCGKHMGESSIARLHMSRFHGGAHLSNFLFYCRKCKVEMPRYEDILSHVSGAHSGHTYFSEQEVPEQLPIIVDVKPSTSSDVTFHSSSVAKVQLSTEVSSSKVEQSWMCRMCEDVFDSEAAVRKHCSDVSSHSFQRFVCGHCPQKFFKESTVRRHCMNEHDGLVKTSYFCGLCDSMEFGSEEEFFEHYKNLHSKDYYCMDEVEVVQPDAADAAAERTSQFTCPCMGSEKSKEDMKATYTQCMRNLAAEEKCQYICVPCDVSVPSYAQIKTHVHTKHTALNLDRSFDIRCKDCQESFMDVPSFHKHYHLQHCTLDPCMSSRTCRKSSKAEPTTPMIPNAAEIKPDSNEIDDETLTFLNIDHTNDESEVQEVESDDEMKRALSLSAEEGQESAELEEALKRSLLEF